jgi:hypothetical protein
MILRRIQAYSLAGILLFALSILLVVVYRFVDRPLRDSREPWSPVPLIVILISGVCILFATAACFRSLQLSWRVARRVNAQLCVQCAYSLKGLTNGICPECGVQQPGTTVADTRRSA